MVTTSREVVKVTFGWEVAYEFEVWIMPHHAGVDLILGTDFMIPAGIRLDLYNSAVKLPDEMVIPLIRSSNAPTKTEFGPNKEQRLYEDWLSHQLPAVERRKYPIPTAVEKRPPPVENGPELTCAERWRTIEADAASRYVISTSAVARGDPAINSAFKLIDVRTDRTPVLHDGQDVAYDLSKFEDDGAISDASTNSVVEGTSAVGAKEEVSTTEDSAITDGDPKERSEQVLRDAQPVIDDRGKFGVIRPSIVGEVNSAMSILTTISAGINHVVTANSALEDPAVENDLGAVPACHGTADYARDECGRVDVCPAVVAESAVQRHSVTTASSKLEVLLSRDVEANSEGLNWTVKTSNHSDEGEARAKYGVDGFSSAAVMNSAMVTPKACIIQSAAIGVTSSATTVFDPGGIGNSLEQAEDDECNSTRNPTETLRQHYVTIAATEDEKEDDEDDSKTDIFERSGTDLELTDYAHELAFLPDLTEVESTEVDYGAPNVKSSSHTPAQSARLNLAVYGAVLYQLKDTDFGPGGDLTSAKAVAEAPILRHFDPAKGFHLMLYANDWALSSTMMQPHDDKLHPVRFCGRVLKENELGYHPAEKEVVALLQLLKVCYTLLAGKTLHVYTRFSTLEWVFKSKSLYGRAVSSAVMLSPYDLKVKRVRERDVDFAQLLQASITSFIELADSLKHLAPPSNNSATVRMDPELLYARIPADFAGCVQSFDGSAKTAKYGGYGSCSWILWCLSNWDIEIAASAYLSSTTVNIAEYTGMNNGVLAAIDRGIADLIIVGNSRLAIQQSMGVIACKKEALQVELARHKDLTKRLNSVRYRHMA
ncbi:hypothetical protein PInf_007713 [Phytophthora infestans]|nr:hypothetical protein PInf_007713 [Phytophthora infestans]